MRPVNCDFNLQPGKAIFSSVHSPDSIEDRLPNVRLPTPRVARLIKNRRFLLCLLVLFVVGAMLWRALRLDQPYYRGKPLQAWLVQHGKATFENNLAAQQDAEAAVRTIGTNAIPIVLTWLTRQDSELQRKHIAFLKGLGLEGSFADSDYHAMASYTCSLLKSEARPLVPELIRLLQQHPAPDIRAAAASVLGQIGPAADASVPFLLQSLDDSVAQDDALAALRSLNVDPKLIVDALAQHLSSNNLGLGQRGWAISRLSAFGADASTVVPQLTPMLTNQHAYLRAAASNALQRINETTSNPEQIGN